MIYAMSTPRSFAMGKTAAELELLHQRDHLHRLRDKLADARARVHAIEAEIVNATRRERTRHQALLNERLAGEA